MYCAPNVQLVLFVGKQHPPLSQMKLKLMRQKLFCEQSTSQKMKY